MAPTRTLQGDPTSKVHRALGRLAKPPRLELRERDASGFRKCLGKTNSPL